MATKPYERIEARDDGYLWLVNHEDEETEQQPLLLHAAASLMKQLKEKWHESIVFSDGEEEDDEEQEESNKDDEDSSEKDGDGDTLMEDANEEEASKQDDVEMEDANNISKKELERVLNLGDRILTTLTHIRLYKHDNRKRKRNNMHSFREGRVKALAHQRDRLQQQKQQQQQEGNTKNADAESTNNQPQQKDADDKEKDFQIVGKKGKNEADEEAFEPQDPHVRLVRTLNSIRALAPVLRQMLYHSERENKDLRLRSVGNKKKTRLPNKKKPCEWLLGNHVFDFANASSCRTMRMNLQELMDFFLPNHTIAKEFMGGTLENEAQFWCNDWLPRTWAYQDSTSNSIHLASPYDVLAEFVSEDDDGTDDIKAKIRKQCQACDDKFFAKEAQVGGKAQSEHKRYQLAVDKLHKKLSWILEKDFPGARLSIYGSCLSNLSLKASDVDLSLFLPQAQNAKKSFQNGFWDPSRYEKEMTRLVREVFRRLIRRQGEYKDMIPVTRARVPVVKGCYMQAKNPYTTDGSLHFDICFLNDIAVANSSLLREYSLIDDSVRELMVVVKKWAKDNKVCSAQDNSLSSYAWLNMVVFYLQCIGFIPNLQCPKLMKQTGLQRKSDEYWHNVNDLDTQYLTFEQVSKVWTRPERFGMEPLSNTALLYGFFNFYAIGFVGTVSMVSIKRGNEEILPKTVFRKCSPFFCIEDPFETFDSHMPHDLGIPVNELQTKRIFLLIQSAEEHLRTHLLGQDDSDGEEFSSLWPWPPVEPEQTNNQGKQGGRDRRRRGKGDRGHGANKDKKKNDNPKQQQNAKNHQAQQNDKSKQSKGNNQHGPAVNGKGNSNKGHPQVQQSNNPPKKGGGKNGNKGKNHTQEPGQNPAEARGGAKGSNNNDKGGRGVGGRGRGFGGRRPRGGRGRGGRGRS